MSQHFSNWLPKLLVFSYGNHHNYLNENILKKRNRGMGLNLCQLIFFYDQIKSKKIIDTRWCTVVSRFFYRSYRNARRGRKGQEGQNLAQFMFSIISSFFIPAVAQNADACVFWKLTFNRDFRSTEFQEIKINSCPALAASWGQCLLRGVLGTKEILGWKSSSRLAGLCPPTTYTIFKQAAWTHCCFSLHVHASLSNFFSYIISGIITNNHIYCGHIQG